MSKQNRFSTMSKKPASQDWHNADVIAAIRKTGTNISQLSLQAGIGYGVLRNALFKPYPTYERLIAAHLGLKPQDIWPSRYHADGTSKSGRGERGIGRFKRKTNNSTATESRNGQAIAAVGKLAKAA